MSLRKLKQCPGCDQWFSVDDICDSPSIEPIGILIDPHDDTNCYLHFVHAVDFCQSTFIIHSRDLHEFLKLPRVLAARNASDPCPGYCASLDELSACESSCQLGVYREFILALKQNRKPDSGVLV